MGYVMSYISRMNLFQWIASLYQFATCTVAPDICPNDNITFWMYNKENLNTGLQITFDSLSSELFERDKGLVVLVHGFSTDRNDPLNTNNREVLINNADVNVISVDFGPLVPFPCYPEAVKNIGPIGRCIALFLDKLIELEIFDKENIHLIGFSLGAHVSGVASSSMKHGTVARITGLDPAGPNITTLPDGEKLDKTDAEFVDIIHTQIGLRGIPEAIGHVDFYPNGGDKQPGCETTTTYAVIDSGDCSHNRATQFYAESITTETGFWGTPCEVRHGTCLPNKNSDPEVLMGYRVEESVRGSYFLTTNHAPPFARGNEHQVQIQQ